jgi:hypothetical protein
VLDPYPKQVHTEYHTPGEHAMIKRKWILFLVLMVVLSTGYPQVGVFFE